MAIPAPLSADQLGELQQRAVHAAHNSYSPYSHFRVGAALLLEPDAIQSGVIICGANVENASYRLTSCAEQAAISAAVSLYGPQIRVRAVAVANLSAATCMPCGACRQTLAEFAGPDTPVFYPLENGETVSTTLAELLPAAFCLTPE
jgi:cytidine deaminase